MRHLSNKVSLMAMFLPFLFSSGIHAGDGYYNVEEKLEKKPSDEHAKVELKKEDSAISMHDVKDLQKNSGETDKKSDGNNINSSINADLEKSDLKPQDDQVMMIKISHENGNQIYTYYFTDTKSNKTKYYEENNKDANEKTIQVDFFRKYSTLHSVLLNTIHMDRNFIDSLEASSVRTPIIKNIVFNDCSIKSTDAEYIDKKLIDIFGNRDDISTIKLGFGNSKHFPSSLLANFAEKCKTITCACLTFNELSELDSNNASLLIQNNKGWLKNIYLMVKKAKNGVLSPIIKSVSDMQELTNLSVSFGDVNCLEVAEFFKNISVSDRLKTLKIDLDMHLFGGDGQYEAAHSAALFLGKLSKLEELDLSGCNIVDYGLSQIYKNGLKGKESLISLQIDGTPINQSNIEFLSSNITNMHNLKSISLKRCGLDNTLASKLIAEINKLKNINSVFLDNNNVSDIDLSSLVKNKYLSYISVSGNDLLATKAEEALKASIGSDRDDILIINMNDNGIAKKDRNIFNKTMRFFLEKNNGSMKVFPLIN